MKLRLQRLKGSRIYEKQPKQKYMCIDTSMYLCVCMDVCLHNDIYIYIYIFIHIYIYIYTYVYVYIAGAREREREREREAIHETSTPPQLQHATSGGPRDPWRCCDCSPPRRAAPSPADAAQRQASYGRAPCFGILIWGILLFWVLGAPDFLGNPHTWNWSK